MIEFRIDDSEAGERIDKIVARRIRELGRRNLGELFRDGRVLLDGKPAKKGERARGGESVSVSVGEGDLVRPEPERELTVVLETMDVVIVNKPAGQPTAPIRLGESGTLANAIVGHYPETKNIGYRMREPGLLHRLDTQTSGLVVVVRNAPAFTTLRAALAAGRIEKHYLAIVSGNAPESGVVEEWLAPDPSSPGRVRVAPSTARGARPAISRFRRIREAHRHHLVEVEVSHAYRHQVRAHLAWLGVPIVGDVSYGGEPAATLGGRHALHASYVAWAGDDAVPGFTATAPLPAELEALLSG